MDILEKIDLYLGEGKSIKKFDDVHVKSKNVTGMVYDIKGDEVVVQTTKGLVKTTMKDLRLVELSGDLRASGTAVAGRMVQSPIEKYKADMIEKLAKKKKKETDSQTSQKVVQATNTYPFQSK